MIYKAVPSWYVKVESFVDRLIENNKAIRWVPSHLRDGRMGSWLKNARDWSISRNRFWGTPLPVWVCDQDSSHVRVFSSARELEELSKKKLEDLHLHYVSDLQMPCESCGGTLKNENLVFDCWFESGSMPYAQHHYPFQNEDHFESVFPAEFIAEGLDQTRGWFYTLIVLSTALFDKPAFKNVIVNGVILDQKGKKMSKRHRNYTPPDELMDKYGADSIRLFMLNSQLLRAEDLVFSDDGVRETTRKVLLPLWNACSFLSTYAHADSWKASAALLEGEAPKVVDEMDRWILSKLQTLTRAVDIHMGEYKLYLVVPEVLEFIDDLTNWYIRLNRKRFWGQNGEGGKSVSLDQDQAYSTLYFVLIQFSKVLAPFAPFLSDRLYEILADDQKDVKESVHLCDRPVFEEALQDEALEERIELIRILVNQGRSLRHKHKIKTRQALPSLTVITKRAKERKYIQESLDLVKTELNVKEVIFTEDEAKHVHLKLRPNLPLLGARLGRKLKEVRAEIQALNSDPNGLHSFVEELENEETTTTLECGVEIRHEELLIDREPIDHSLIATAGGVTILLDTELTPDLVSEGHAREVVNRIQNLRKQSGLDVSDRIQLEIIAPSKLADDITRHKDYIRGETLGTRLEVVANGGECSLKFAESYNIDGMTCIVSLEPE